MNTAALPFSRTIASGGTSIAFTRSSRSMSICTRVSTARGMGPTGVSWTASIAPDATPPVRGATMRRTAPASPAAASRAVAPGSTRDASLAGTEAITSRRPRIDESQDWIGHCARDDVTRVAKPLGNNAGKRGPNHGAGGERIGRGLCGFGAAEFRLRVGQHAVGVLQVPACDQTAFREIARPRLVHSRVFEVGPDTRRLCSLARRFLVGGWDLEPDEQLSSCDRLAFRPGHLDDPRRFGRHGQELRTASRRHDAGDVQHAAHVPDFHRPRRNRHDELLRCFRAWRLLLTTGGRQAENEDQGAAQDHATQAMRPAT